VDQTGRKDRLGEIQKDVEIIIRRSDPHTPAIPNEVAYTVPYSEGMTLHSVLEYIYTVLDPTIAFRRYKCNRGICMSCVVTVNGKKRQACSTFIKPGDHLLIEPIHGRHVIRDLVTDF
jgi:succinate dehydrogenase/fumarate reductase-like Fe-S protein